MIQFDIDYTKEKSAELAKLQSEITSLLSEINEAYLSIDLKKWNNKDKTKLDEVFLKYLNLKTNNINNGFSRNIGLINNSIKEYEEKDLLIKKSIGGV